MQETINNNATAKKTHEPLIHITKRPVLVWWKAWLIRAGAVIAALAVCGIITLLFTDLKPWDVYIAMFNGNFGPNVDVWVVFRDLSILLIISLAVTPAFKMRFWNIGAEGQVLIGGLVSAMFMVYLKDSLPNALLILAMLVASILAGAIWAFIPAFFKARWRTNETLFTLMMNYIAMQCISFALSITAKNGSGVLGIVNQTSRIGWLPDIFNNKYVLTIIFSVVLTAILFVYLKYSKHGYEISVVGESEKTAKYIGINVNKVVIRTLIFSGALCGLCGFLLVSGKDHTISTTTVDGQGFTAIIVSWLAKFNPLYMLLTAFLVIFLKNGGRQIATDCKNINLAFSDILVGIILFFIIGCEFFIQYNIHFCKSHKEGE